MLEGNQKFYFHDVLQVSIPNKDQKRELKKYSHFEIFKMGMKPFENVEGIDVILLIMSEGIDSQPEVVEYIKAHPKWIIGCHGLNHTKFNRKTREEALHDLTIAKKKIEETFNRPLKIFIPPWLRYNEATKSVCDELGLEIHSKGFFAIKYMDVAKINEYPRIDIHHWVSDDRDRIDFFFKFREEGINEKT